MDSTQQPNPPLRDRIGIHPVGCTQIDILRPYQESFVYEYAVVDVNTQTTEYHYESWAIDSERDGKRAVIRTTTVTLKNTTTDVLVSIAIIRHKTKCAWEDIESEDTVWVPINQDSKTWP